MNSDLKNEMLEYSDKRIINTLKSQDFYDKETINIAKEIAFERGIVNEQQLQNINQIAAQERSKRESENKNGLNSGATIGIGTVIFILFIIIKWVLRAMNN